jgi:hypothetical protein
MKKVLFVLVLIMSVLVVNAQVTKTTECIRDTVKVADLQKTITDNIAKDYTDFIIKEAVSVTVSDIKTYEVIIVNGTIIETLVYDKNGLFIKKLPQDFVKPLVLQSIKLSE